MFAFVQYLCFKINKQTVKCRCMMQEKFCIRYCFTTTIYGKSQHYFELKISTQYYGVLILHCLDKYLIAYDNQKEYDFYDDDSKGRCQTH